MDKMSKIRLTYHEKNSGENDPVEYEFEDSHKSLTDLVYELIGDKKDTVFLLSFSKKEVDDCNFEVFVSSNSQSVQLVLSTWNTDLETPIWHWHLQEYEDFYSAYEVAYYMREGHPLANSESIA